MTGQRADASGAGKDLWHYAVGSDKRGPVARTKIAELLAAGEINAETYVWQPGMDNWVHLGEAPALRSLAEVAEIGAAPSDAYVAHDDFGDEEGLSSDTIIEPLSDRDMKALQAAQQASSGAGELFTETNDSGDFFGSSDSSDKTIADSAPLGVHGRRESSVLFKLDDLGREEGRAGAEEPFATESSGLLDISAIANQKGGADPFGNSAPNLVVSPRSGGVAPLTIPIVERKKSSTPIIIAILAVLLVGGIAFFFINKSNQEQAQTAAAASAEVEKAKAEAAALAATAKAEAEKAKAEAEAKIATAEAERLRAEADKAKAEAEAKAKAEAEVAAAAAAKAEAESKAADERASAAAERRDARRDGGTGTATPTTPRPSTGGGTTESKIQAATNPNNSAKVNDLLGKLNSGGGANDGAAAGGGEDVPQKLSAAAVRSAIRGRFGSCSSMNSAGPATVQTQFVISSSGVVQSASVTNGGGTTPDVQRCVVDVLKSTKFGRFKDATMQVNLPVSLN